MQKSVAFEISRRHSRYVEHRQIGRIEAAKGGEIKLLVLTGLDRSSDRLENIPGGSCSILLFCRYL